MCNYSLPQKKTHNKISKCYFITFKEACCLSSFKDKYCIISQEVSVHVYEKKSSATERVGRGKRREAIAELLRNVQTNVRHY